MHAFCVCVWLPRSGCPLTQPPPHCIGASLVQVCACLCGHFLLGVAAASITARGFKGMYIVCLDVPLCWCACVCICCECLVWCVWVGSCLQGQQSIRTVCGLSVLMHLRIELLHMPHVLVFTRCYGCCGALPAAQLSCATQRSTAQRCCLCQCNPGPNSNLIGACLPTKRAELSLSVLLSLL